MKSLILLLLLPAVLRAQGTRTPPPGNVWAAQTELRSITLVWKRTAQAEGYRVYPVGTTPARGIPAGKLAKTVDHLSIALIPGYKGSYSYRVAAVYPGGVLSRKVASNAVVPAMKRPPGAIAPKSVTATETTSGVITVSWTSVTGATGYFIGRSVAPGGFRTICDVCSTEPKFVDRKVTAGAKHIYTVAALTPAGLTKRTQSNAVTPTGSGTGDEGGGGPADSTVSDSSGTPPADTLAPHGVRVFTAQNQSGGERGQVRLRWSPDLRATRYLIAFVDTVDDARYTPDELILERTVYSGSDTATTINAPGDTTRINYAIASQNSHGRSELRYATRAADAPSRDSTPADSTTTPDSSTASTDSSSGPKGVRNLRMAITLPRPGIAAVEVRWSADPQAARYHVDLSWGEDSTWHELQVKPGSDTTYLTQYGPNYPTEECRVSVVSEDRTGKTSARQVVSGVPGPLPPPGQGPEGVKEFTATYRPGGEWGNAALSWSPDPHAFRYHLFSSDASGRFIEFSVVQSGTTADVALSQDFKDGGTFRIVSEDTYGNRSSPKTSNRVMGKAPLGVERFWVAIARPPRGLELNWKPDNAASEYIISRSDDGGPFREVARPKAAWSYIDAPPTGHTVGYRIVPRNGYGEAAPSSTGQFEWRQWFPPGGVTNAAAALESGKVHLRWTPDPAATSYEIRKSVNGRAAIQLATLPGDQAEYLDAQPLGLARVTYEILSSNRSSFPALVRFPESFGGGRDSLGRGSGTDSAGPVVKP
jgi:hypothetical protein